MEISRTFALPFEKRVSDKGIEFLPRLTLRKKSEKFSQKFWRLKNKAYLCNPNRKRGLFGGFDKFIEKTDLLYKKQVPRNTIYREALILLKNYKCQDKLKIYNNYTMKSLILAQDER